MKLFFMIFLVSVGTTVGHSVTLLPVTVPKSTLPPLGLSPQETDRKISKTILNKYTLSLTPHLFGTGMRLSTPRYGQYFANLETTDHRMTLSPSLSAARFSAFRKSPTHIHSGLRVGGLTPKDSRIFLKLSFDSHQHAALHRLRTPYADPNNGTYWKTRVNSGVGFEYPVFKQVAVSGEVSRGLQPSTFDKSTKAHDKTVRLGLRYHFNTFEKK
jgi:hypothetical protein